jgi:4-amino-4-deoxy-L-arabinose transferase
VGTGVFSVLDGMLAAFLTMAMTAFYFAAQSPRGSLREGSFLTLFGIGCGLAFLTKGFLAFAVPVVVIVPYMIWAGRWKDLFPMSVIPIIAAVVVCLPWALAVHHKAPDYWNYFFWQEHVKRFMAEDAQHQAPFWTYLAAFSGSCHALERVDSDVRHGHGPLAAPDAPGSLCPVLVRVPAALFFGRLG